MSPGVKHFNLERGKQAAKFSTGHTTQTKGLNNSCTSISADVLFKPQNEEGKVQNVQLELLKFS